MMEKKMKYKPLRMEVMLLKMQKPLLAGSGEGMGGGPDPSDPDARLFNQDEDDDRYWDWA